MLLLPKSTEFNRRIPNEYNFKNFVLAIRSAGFISPKLLRSKMTLDFCYTLFLILQKSHKLHPQKNPKGPDHKFELFVPRDAFELKAK